MNILIVSAMFPPIRTGTSFYTLNLAYALCKSGHQASVVTLENREASRDDYPFDVDRLPSIHFPVKNYFKHLRIASLFPSNYTSVESLANKHNADVVLLVNHYLDIAFPAIFAARRNRIPIVCSVGTQLQSPSKWRHRTLNLLDRMICGQLIFPSCSRIVAWDDQITRYLLDVHGDAISRKIAVVNYGVNGDMRYFENHKQEYASHGQILGVGAVIEQRDFTALVQAFRLVADDFPNYQLKIVGHIYTDRAVRLAEDLGLSDRVVFTGEKPHDFVLEEFTRSDVYFASLTGRYVGLGTATIEAMLMGVPTIVNAYPDILGVACLEHMRDLVLLDRLDPDGIATHLRSLLGDEDLRKSMGMRGRAFVREHLAWEKVASDFEKLLETVVRESRASQVAPRSLRA